MNKDMLIRDSTPRLKARVVAFALDRGLDFLISGGEDHAKGHGGVSQAGIVHLLLNLVERLWPVGSGPAHELVPALEDLLPGGNLSPLPWMGARGRPQSEILRSGRERKASVDDFWQKEHGVATMRDLAQIKARYSLLMKYRQDLLLEGKRTAEEVREALAKAGLPAT